MFLVKHKLLMSICACLSESVTSFMRLNMQVDLGGKFRVCAVATQGSPGEQKRFVKEYKLRWSNDNVNWDTSSEVGPV